jgi:hypothetical protein
MWVGVVVVVVSAHYLWWLWRPRITSWPDRRPWAATASTVPAGIVGLIERHPEAAVALAVPGTIIGIAGVAAHPFVFVPLLVLAGAALVMIRLYNRGQRGGQQRMWVAAGRQRSELEAEAKAAEAVAAKARALAAQARARAIRLRLEAEANVKPVTSPDRHRT